MCVVNGENIADGVGITPKLADRLLAAGADAITLGNHTWRRQEIAPYLAASDRVVRPANLSADAPGRGMTIVDAGGVAVAVINVMGSLSLEPARSMWELVDALVDEATATTPVVLVDVHAEATSEKVALARWLDGRVTAVIGTHTHVQTSDARVQPGGTARDHGCGNDGTARLRDRGQGRARDAPDANRHAGSLRGGDRRCADRRSARRVRSGYRAGDCDPAGARSLALTRATSTTKRATRTASRTSTSQEAVSSNFLTRSQYVFGNHSLVRKHARRRSDDAIVPRLSPTSTTTARSHTRNCGEMTLPKATNATIAAAQ